MAGMLANIIAPTILLAFVFPVKGSNQDKKQWLYKLATSLQQHDGTDSGPLWNLAPYVEDESSMRLLDQVPEFVSLLDSPQNTQRNKKSYPFDGLLCCNHPPTRPPVVKKSPISGGRLRTIVLSNLGQSLVTEVANNQQDNNLLDVSLPELRQGFRSRIDETRPEVWDTRRLDQDEDSIMLQRRGYTVVRGGVSDVNTGG